MNARQIASGLGWSALATVVMAVCQFVFMAVLARLLDPSAFGLMAMASIVLRFASYFSQMGVAQALIQRDQLTAADTTAALAMALLIGSVLYAVVVLAAPLAALAFRTPELVHLVGVLGASLVIGTVSGLPLALLRRAGRFRRSTVVELSSFIVGYGAVGIACAHLGMGVWSLVAATLCQQALCTALGVLAVRYPLSWPLQRRSFDRLWAYGSRYSAVGIVEFLFSNVDSLLIGRAFGKVDLGLYNRAVTLTSMPVEFGVSAVNKVLFPALAGMQHDRARMADGFQMLLLGIGVLSTSLACGVAAASTDAVALLLGARWSAVAPLVAVVALAVPPVFMFVACGVTLDSLGALRPKLRLQGAMLGLKVVAVLWASRWGLPGIAWAMVAVETLRLAVGIRLLGRLLCIDAARLWSVVGLIATLGLGVAGTVAVASSLGRASGAPLPLRVLLDTAAGGLALAGWLLLTLRSYPHYAPLQRFEAVRRIHDGLLRSLHVVGAATP